MFGSKAKFAFFIFSHCLSFNAPPLPLLLLKPGPIWREARPLRLWGPAGSPHRHPQADTREKCGRGRGRLGLGHQLHWDRPGQPGQLPALTAPHRTLIWRGGVWGTPKGWQIRGREIFFFLFLQFAVAGWYDVQIKSLCSWIFQIDRKRERWFILYLKMKEKEKKPTMSAN